MTTDYDHMAAAPCPVCEHRCERILTRKLRRGHGVVFYCDHCHFGFLVQTLLAEAVLDDGDSLRQYYARDYRQHVSHKAEPGATNPEEIFAAYSRYQGDRLRLFQDVVRNGPVDSVLEIGASAGQFLRHIDHYGARRCAIEFDPACCEYMKRMDIDVDDKSLAESRFHVERFDVVCAFQVMEHALDPVQFLADIKAVLKPGGVAIVEVPNLHDALRGLWGCKEYDAFYFHADHRFYFSARALKQLGRRAGFRNPEIRFTQDYNVLNHLHWLMTGRPQADCHAGLAPPSLPGNDTSVRDWLIDRLQFLNHEYIQKLTSTGTTSNITMILQG
jgi:2-polyprenyl-3-methyl-5-hydroxy-6-metoxy-1,4-benzoquinol methylase